MFVSLLGLFIKSHRKTDTFNVSKQFMGFCQILLKKLLIKPELQQNNNLIIKEIHPTFRVKHGVLINPFLFTVYRLQFTVVGVKGCSVYGLRLLGSRAEGQGSRFKGCFVYRLRFTVYGCWGQEPRVVLLTADC